MMVITLKKTRYTASTKKKVAQMLQVCERTLRYWLNERYYEGLTAIGYTKHQKYLTPKQVGYLDDILDFWE